MAVSKIPKATSLRIALLETVDGETKTVTRSYSNIKHTAADASILAVGNTIVGLQDLPLSNIMRRDDAVVADGV